MTSEMICYQEGDKGEFPRLVCHRTCGTVVLVRSVDDDGFYNGVCIHDPSGISDVGFDGRWSAKEYATFKGDIVLHG